MNTQTAGTNMRILQVLCGGSWGGGSVVVHAIVHSLIKRGDQVWVVCTDDDNARKFAEIGARIVRAHTWTRPINPMDLAALTELLFICFRIRFDLVATHTSKGGIIGRFAARLARVPHIIHHAHGFYFNSLRKSRRRAFYLALERWAARTGDMIISVSEEHRRLAIQAGVDSPDRICTVLNGIDLRPYLSADGDCVRRELGFCRGDILIGALNRFVPEKGVEHLIAAFAKLADEFPSASLLLCGEGPLEVSFRRHARAIGIEKRIHFLGFRHDTPRVLAALDIFVQPSVREGLSIALLEGLASGKPVVTCKIPGVTDAVTHGITGLLVPPADPDALAGALIQVIRNPELARSMGANARKEAVARFSLELMVSRTLKVYDFLAAHSRKQRYEHSIFESLHDQS